SWMSGSCTPKRRQSAKSICSSSIAANSLETGQRGTQGCRQGPRIIGRIHKFLERLVPLSVVDTARTAATFAADIRSQGITKDFPRTAGKAAMRELFGFKDIIIHQHGLNDKPFQCVFERKN